MDRIGIFAGTTEGRVLAEQLDDMGASLVVSVATDYGKEALPKLKRGYIHTGRMSGMEMAGFLKKHQVTLAIDATHPYAKDATRQIELACKETGIRRIRCLRGREIWTREERKELSPWIRRFSGALEIAQWLKGREGNILLTTGSRELAAFCQIPQFENRVYARVLPDPKALEICRELGLKGRHIIAAQGPFSVMMNQAMLKEYDCRFLVTKDSGREGGFLEKVKAAARTGIPALVIDRGEAETGMTVDEVINWYERQTRK